MYRIAGNFRRGEIFTMFAVDVVPRTTYSSIWGISQSKNCAVMIKWTQTARQFVFYQCVNSKVSSYLSATLPMGIDSLCIHHTPPNQNSQIKKPLSHAWVMEPFTVASLTSTQGSFQLKTLPAEPVVTREWNLTTSFDYHS